MLLAAACLRGADERLTSPATQLVADRRPVGVQASLARTLDAPTRIAITDQGRLIVSDAAEAKQLVGERDQGRVVTLDPVSLLPVAEFRVWGKPLAVGQAAGRVFVGNAATHTIEAYRTDGRRIMDFGPGAVGIPQDLAIDAATQRIYVLDAASREVRVFDFRGALVGMLAANLGMESPTALALDPVRREILVSDYGATGGHASIWLLTYDGALIRQISGQGSCGMLGCRNGFSRPQGLAVDGWGRVLVADCLLGQVLVLDHDSGSLIGTIGSRDPGLQQLRLPLDVAIDASGDLYVTSSRAGAVVSFRSGAALP